MEKISNFKAFSKASANDTAIKLGEENETKRGAIAERVKSVLSDMDISSLDDLTEDQKDEFINNLFASETIRVGDDDDDDDDDIDDDDDDDDGDDDDDDEISEAEVTSDDDFRDFAEATLKKAFGDDYDEEKAKKTIDGIIQKNDGDYGAMVGTLQSSIGK
tara:strand:- start:13 stop:495 length:483 start_codon:yes stop_codon:yes gene_type:complete